jgi:hypothetical protein
MILVRKPYDIGDRVHVGDVNQPTDPTGSDGWIVEKVDLYSTTMRLGATREVATVANGNLANSRIINMKRSEKAILYVYLKFGVDVPYIKIKEFKEAVMEFIKARPREWLAMTGFRSTRIEADLGYIEYVVVAQHRESWQQIVAVLNSRSAVSSFCLELQKEMNMKYVAPSLPVNLGIQSMNGAENNKLESAGEEGETPAEPTAADRIRALAELFESKKTK